jgi:dTDP-4-dehydrorhamnose reductase
MNVLVLGHDGQLGSDFMRCAGEHPDVAVSPLSRNDLDLENIADIQPALKTRTFDVLVNCTGYHKTDDVESDAQRAVVINAHAVREMAQACSALGARLVHISTDYVFDGRSDVPYTETDGMGPLNVYGAAKAMSEAFVHVNCEDHVIFRVASLFGVAGSMGKGGNFVETMIRLARERGTLRVVADQRMSPTATGDVAAMMLAAIEKNIASGTYHAVNTGNATWFEFAQRIVRLTVPKATVEPIPASEYPLPAARPAYSVLSNAKLSAAIGPIPTWEDALQRYLVAKGHCEA